jgi:hypothetical protein
MTLLPFPVTLAMIDAGLEAKLLSVQPFGHRDQAEALVAAYLAEAFCDCPAGIVRASRATRSERKRDRRARAEYERMNRVAQDQRARGDKMVTQWGPSWSSYTKAELEAYCRVWLAQRIAGLGRYQLADFTLAMLNTEVPRPDAPFSSGVRPEVCVAEDRRNLITALLLGDSLSSSGPEPETK